MFEPVGQGAERRRIAATLTGGRQAEAVRREQIVKDGRRFFQKQIKTLLKHLVDGVHLRGVEIAALVFPPAFQLRTGIDH